ncbi:MAG TPA: CYTH domain-containing protein [Patescibacteria group bacterium]|jgi:adenylate cyclase class 2|nr:CYTH domain-containing protein [Patescibacteria group bacterium]
MKVEFEATFENINKDEIREKLKAVGAELVRPEFLQRRKNFNLPKGNDIQGGWLRVRDEGDKITMSLKVVDGVGIESQKETEIIVNDFDEASSLLESIGCVNKSFQESKRELWKLDNVHIMIDEWPFLEPYIEVEGSNESEVKAVSEKLGFDYSTALFDAADAQYAKKYNISTKAINERTPEILFNMQNPFINRTDE